MTRTATRPRLPLTEPYVTLFCVPLVALTRIGLTVLGFKRLSKWGAPNLNTQVEFQPSFSDLQRVGAAVSRASRLVPGASCLTQALAARLYLRQLGLQPELRIGVAKDDNGKFIAHAWLDCGGMTVVGGADNPTKYQVMPQLDESCL